jgi:hypothetical protein
MHLERIHFSSVQNEGVGPTSRSTATSTAAFRLLVLKIHVSKKADSSSTIESNRTQKGKKEMEFDALNDQNLMFVSFRQHWLLKKNLLWSISILAGI